MSCNESQDAFLLTVCVQQLWSLFGPPALHSDGSLHLHHVPLVSPPQHTHTHTHAGEYTRCSKPGSKLRLNHGSKRRYSAFFSSLHEPWPNAERNHTWTYMRIHHARAHAYAGAGGRVQTNPKCDWRNVQANPHTVKCLCYIKISHAPS